MGLGHAFLWDLIELKREGELEGARDVVEIGAQQIADSLIGAPELSEAYTLFGCVSPPDLRPVGKEKFTQLAPSSDVFWASLGFERTAVDIEGGAITLDLNRDRTPNNFCKAFDLVVNTGTTEHVANQSNAFEIIHDLTRVGGVMYHEVPAGGMINHGLISYQPRFFHLLAETNSYDLLFLKFSAWGQSIIPNSIRDKKRGGNSVMDCTLRVALRKKVDQPFNCPLDVRSELRQHTLLHRGAAKMASFIRRSAATLRFVRNRTLGG
jgi:hypothetical protein